MDHGAFGEPVIAGLVVLQSEVSNLVTQCQQKVIFAIMSRAEESTGFSHQALVFVDNLRRHLQGGIAVRSNVEIVLDWSLRGQWDAAKMPARQHWRIHQGGQRDSTKIDLPGAFVV